MTMAKSGDKTWWIHVITLLTLFTIGSAHTQSTDTLPETTTDTKTAPKMSTTTVEPMTTTLQTTTEPTTPPKMTTTTVEPMTTTLQTTTEPTTAPKIATTTVEPMTTTPITTTEPTTAPKMSTTTGEPMTTTGKTTMEQTTVSMISGKPTTTISVPTSFAMTFAQSSDSLPSSTKISTNSIVTTITSDTRIPITSMTSGEPTRTHSTTKLPATVTTSNKPTSTSVRITTTEQSSTRDRTSQKLSTATSTEGTTDSTQGPSYCNKANLTGLHAAIGVLASLLAISLAGNITFVIYWKRLAFPKLTKLKYRKTDQSKQRTVHRTISNPIEADEIVMNECQDPGNNTQDRVQSGVYAQLEAGHSGQLHGQNRPRSGDYTDLKNVPFGENRNNLGDHIYQNT